MKSKSLKLINNEHMNGCYILLYTLCVHMAALGQTTAKVIEKRPNIVFILADDLGYGDVRSFNPAGKIATPNMDKLASEGMKFTNAHSSSSVCTPSRYSILTGRYNSRSTLPVNPGYLDGFSDHLIPTSRLTVASYLKSNGYKTACLGKWHLGMDWQRKKETVLESAEKEGFNVSPKEGWDVDYRLPVKNGPTSSGFDYFYGISASLDMPPYAFIDNDRTVGIPSETKFYYSRSGASVKNFNAVDVVPNITQKAKTFIQDCSFKKQPFFLYFSLPSPHTPIVPTKDFNGKSNTTKYGDYVMETDWAVGEVVKQLDSLGLSDNTIIFVTSDNGFAPYVLQENNVEQLGHFPSYTFRGYKADIWEGGHHVPLIVRWPNVVKAGSVCGGLVSLTDFFATCASILNKTLPANAGEDSYDILPLLSSGNPDTGDKAIIVTSLNGNFSIMQGKWKLILSPGSGGWAQPKNKEAYEQGLPVVQLYDMSADVRESYNVEKNYPEVVERLTKLLEEKISNGRSTPGKKVSNDVKIDIWKKATYQK